MLERSSRYGALASLSDKVGCCGLEGLRLSQLHLQNERRSCGEVAGAAGTALPEHKAVRLFRCLQSAQTEKRPKSDHASVRVATTMLVGHAT